MLVALASTLPTRGRDKRAHMSRSALTPLQPVGSTAPVRVAMFAPQEAEMADRRRAQQMRIRLSSQWLVTEFVLKVEGRRKLAWGRARLANSYRPGVYSGPPHRFVSGGFRSRSCHVQVSDIRLDAG